MSDKETKCKCPLCKKPMKILRGLEPGDSYGEGMECWQAICYRCDLFILTDWDNENAKVELIKKIEAQDER